MELGFTHVGITGAEDPNRLNMALDACLKGDEPTIRCDCPPGCPRNQKAFKRANRKDLFLEQLEGEFDPEQILFMDEEYYELVVRPIMYNYITDWNIFRRSPLYPRAKKSFVI